MLIATPHFSYIQAKATQESYNTLENGQWLLIINFSSPISVSWNNGIVYELIENSLNFAYLPKSHSMRIQTGTSTELNNYALLILHPLWFDKLLDTVEKRNKNNIEQNNKPTFWSFCAKNIPHTIFTPLKALGDLSPNNFYQQQLSQAYVTQIITQTIPLFREGSCNQFCHISERDYQKVRQAEQFIRSNINESCVLISLAKKVGMNDCSLKKAFKEVYGTSIFKYLNNLRMQRAISLLHQDLSIGQIADEIGYKNHSNFTEAFKRTYGYSPKELRQNPNAYQTIKIKN